MKESPVCGPSFISVNRCWRTQAFPILNILVLQTGQAPSVAGLPFFIVIAFGSFISRLTRHLRQ